MCPKEEGTKREGAAGERPGPAERPAERSPKPDVERAASRHIKRNKKALTELSKW